MRFVLVVLAALALAAPAAAGNVATPRMAAVASWAAGKPVSVWCESDAAEWRALASRYGYDSPDGFTMFAEPVVYIGPGACWRLADGHDMGIGVGLNILLHESAHQRGFRDEDLAECAARLLIYSALYNFYGVPWFSKRMHAITEAALAFSRGKPAAYQGGCDRL